MQDPKSTFNKLKEETTDPKKLKAINLAESIVDAAIQMAKTPIVHFRKIIDLVDSQFPVYSVVSEVE